MNKHVKSAHSGLFAVRLAVSLALAAPAAVFGQSASLLEEVTVTATRQTETANRIPMSIAAVTQESLDQIGIKSASDLTQIVPALTLVNQTAGVGTFAIRGIVATTGAATTGVYLDDTALTKRNNPGVSQNNGAPLPLLFDLQRVEVLKGPQGTLYGGSSQGGTIRFITPTPSLTDYSGMMRAETYVLQNGAPSTELGGAFGGPLIDGSLGMRVSAIARNTGGWIDTLNVYDGGRIDRKDANGVREWAIRAAFAKKLGDNGMATLAWYRSAYRTEGGPGSQTEVYAPNGTRAPATQTFTTPETCYNTSTRAPTATTAPPTVNCNTAPVITFRRAAQTYGPFNYLDRDESLTPFDGVYGIGKTDTSLPSFTVDFTFGDLDFKAITSYIDDHTIGDAGEGHDPSRVQTTLENPGRTSFPLFRPVQVYAGRFISSNKRNGIEQEVRLSSAAGDGRFGWVAGAYYARLRTHIDYTIYGNYDAPDLALYGLTSAQRYGVPNPNGYVSVLDARLVDTELAFFGEGTYAITDTFKLTAGLRWSEVKLDFTQANYGQLSARPSISSPFAFVQGNGKDTPLTPKVGLQWEPAAGMMVYANGAKGFRAGGVNVPLNPQVCSAGLAQFGLTVDDISKQYGPDTVKSYELGTKLRLLDGRMQLNVAAYQIDWNDIQVTTSAQGCGQNWNQNGGKARSKGFDVQLDYRPIDPMTLSVSLSTVDAKYREAVLGPVPTVSGVTQAVTFNKGDPLGVPDLQANAGMRFDFSAFDHRAYARLDYLYSGSYLQGSSFGTGNYNPFTRDVGSTDQVNARLGINIDRWDLSLYSVNLLNSRDKIGNSGIGRGGCNAATGGTGCTVYSLFNPFVNQAYQKPRTIGVQANYRF
ncbi:MAG: TonB-dependent receptor [Gammaproteobacteria bacterium]|nr:TonB-dependent receptor [Gammaproteobacteria bacterium]